MKAQPAIKSYYFGKGYRDLWGTIKDSWKHNTKDAGNFFLKAAQCGPYALRFDATIDNIKKMFFHIAALSVYVFGGLWYIILSSLHILFLGTLFIGVYIGFSGLWLFDRIYRWYYKLFRACPVYHKIDLPIYYCSNIKCGKKHDELRPGPYGILNRTCECGEKLPTSFLNGREQLYSVCSFENPDGTICEEEIKEGDLTKPIIIPFLGTRSTGKTCYKIALTKQIEENKAWKFGFENDNISREFKLSLNDFKQGNNPGQTNEFLPKFFEFCLEKDTIKHRRKIHLLDPAGELFSPTTSAGNKIKKLPFDYFDGAVYIIDPFAIKAVRDQYGVDENDATIKPAGNGQFEIFEEIINTLKENFPKFKDTQTKVPLAIVINKVDNFDLEDKLGEQAATDYKYQNKLKTIEAAYNKLCEQFLLDNGQGSILQKLKVNFPKYQFFTISTTEFRRVDAPFIWLMNQVDKDFMK